jgi:hypothetical protein
MNLTIQAVDTNYVAQIWHLVQPFIAEALTKGGSEDDANYDVSHVQVYLTTGTWLLVVAVDENKIIQGAATISFINYPIHRVAFVTTIGGKLISNDNTFAQFSELLKQRGATKIQGFAREAIVRLWSRYSFKPINTLVEVRI